ncbi:MAG TPA: GNAT family N-acetyltransferase [Nonomuraea sp.]|nr:GNAT family N-acetyltransferase [Nonomuraea sp.]
MLATIRQGHAGDIDPAARLIAKAFGELQAARWLVPDKARRDTVLANHFRLILAQALDHGVVDVIDVGLPVGDDSDVRYHLGPSPVAVAVWIDRDGPLPELPDYDLLLEAATGDNAGRFRLLGELFDEHQPAESHYYLALLAVHPDCQGDGLGTALVHHHLNQRPDTPVYLEASSPRSRKLYARLGWEDQGDPFPLPDGTLFWPMWRPADHTDDESLL